MSDLALIWDSQLFSADADVELNDLATDTGLATATLLSLFTDRLSEEATGQFPADRRGWWGDVHPVVSGDRIGSRLWLLEREKASESTRVRAEEYAREALAWLLEDQVAERVDVVASYPARGVLALAVDIYRPGMSNPIRYRFDHVWSAMEA